MIKRLINKYIEKKYVIKTIKDLPMGFVLFIAISLISFVVNDPSMILYGLGVMTGYYIAILLILYRVVKGLL